MEAQPGSRQDKTKKPLILLLLISNTPKPKIKLQNN